MGALDFETLRRELQARARELIPEILPGGRLEGREWVCGDHSGGPGKSFKINVDTCVWADFADDQARGGDLVSLYALQRGLSQGEAAKYWRERLGLYRPGGNGGNGGGAFAPKPAVKSRAVAKARPPSPPAERPPPDAGQPNFTTSQGTPSGTWVYRDRNGWPLFYVARYETPAGKDVRPFTWRGGRWRQGGWPVPRPLYNLPGLTGAGQALPVMVVEGEKAAEAARSLLSGFYAVVTWCGGCAQVRQADWSALSGRKVVIWPDADEPGVKAAGIIAEALLPICPEVKVLQVLSGGKADGWDAADAVAEGLDAQAFFAWAKPLVKVAEPPAPEVAIELAIEPSEVLDEEPPAPTDADAPIEVRVNFVGESEAVSESLQAKWDSLGLAVNRNGQPYLNVDNTLRLFQRDPAFSGGVIWFDEFHQRVMTTLGGTGEPRLWAENDWRTLRARLQGEYGLRMLSRESAEEALWLHAMKDRRSEPRDWMNSLKWDGVARVPDFFPRAFGSADTEYFRAVSVNWWVSLVARSFEPGCKVDNMVVLEGGQGRFKSTALHVLGGKWYVDCSERADTKDFFLVLRGSLIVEISELDSFSKVEANAIKKVITCRTDRFRPPYARDAEDFPRRCVFVGTTNDDAYLRDVTGARRFWPVAIKQVDMDYLAQYREQFFAEAVHLYKAKTQWWNVPNEAAAEQERRRERDAWEEEISIWLGGRMFTTVVEVAVQCLKIDVGRIDRMAQMRIGKCLKVCGWERKHTERGNLWGPKN